MRKSDWMAFIIIAVIVLGALMLCTVTYYGAIAAVILKIAQRIFGL